MQANDSKKRKDSMIEAGLTQEFVKECLNYDPDTGLLTWALPSGYKRVQGQDVTVWGPGDYRNIWLKSRLHRAHRVIWLWWYGTVPDREIDHIDKNKTNNRISNLRLATTSENLQNKPMYRNNTTGLPGIYERKANTRFPSWSVSIQSHGIYAYLGNQRSLSDAFFMYCMAKMIAHPFAFSGQEQ